MLTLSLFHSLPHLRNLKTKVCPTRTSRKTTLLEPRDLLFYFRRTSACDIVICNGRLNVQSSRVFKTRNHCFLGRTRLKPLIQWCGWIKLNVQFELNPLLLAENLVDEVKINMPHLPSGENVSAVQKKKKPFGCLCRPSKSPSRDGFNIIDAKLYPFLTVLFTDTSLWLKASCGYTINVPHFQ